MWGVLDDDLVDGVVAAEVHLRPAREARLVDDLYWDAAVTEVTRACQVWAGVADLLVPVVAGAALDPYPRLLRESELDGAVGAADDIAPHLSGGLPHRAPALIALGTTEREQLKELEVCSVPPGDPWELSYLTALGTLPAAPDPAQLGALLLREDLTFETVVPVRRVTATAPGPQDMASRLRATDSFTPFGMSLYRLRPRPARMVQARLDGWLLDRYAFARQQGASIVVVYTPRSVADLCLVWNLRALHGWPAGLPLAVPIADDVLVTVDVITELLAHAGNGIGGWPIMLTSATVGEEALAEIVQRLDERGQSAERVTPGNLLRPAQPPARSSDNALAFDAGAAIVATRTDRDRQDLAVLTRLPIPLDLRLTVQLPQHPLPPVRSLRAGLAAAFTGGGYVVDASRDRLAEVHWPTGFTLLRAAAQDQGVDSAPSASGRTAMALLRALRSLDDVAWLAHRPLLALLYKKAASSGMTWWKQRATEQAAIVAGANADPEVTADRLLAAINSLSVSHGGESAATLTFGELCQEIGDKNAAVAWLEWAERRALLVRGATVRCPRCQHEGWRPLAEIAPPIACPGCGAANDRPFAETAMPFSYRLGEVLRRAIENDSIYHLLAMRALARILDDGPDRLVGAHPGVDFTRDGQRVEADVVAVLASGMIIPAEVKARSTGLRNHDLEQLNALADWLDATTLILVTGDDDTQLAAEFIAAARTDPLPRRRLLTADDWLDPRPMTTVGSRYPGPDVSQDYVSLSPRTKTAADHDAAFATRLRDRAPLDAAVDPTAASLGPSV
ncbi:MAG: hypothetical protein ACJ74O_17940 [Frankiaceae bacterium]